MQVQAIMRNVPMSAQKMREVVRQIQGLNALHAQALLAVVPRKSARAVAKTLKSALGNAEDWKATKPEHAGINIEALRVKLAVAGPGPTRKSFVPKARGSAGPILMRSCYIKIVLSDE